MRSIAASAIMIAVLTGSAYSQSVQDRQNERGSKVEKTPLQQEQEERARQARDVDKDYEAAMKRSSTTTPKMVVDPWARVRPNSGASGDRK